VPAASPPDLHAEPARRSRRGFLGLASGLGAAGVAAVTVGGAPTASAAESTATPGVELGYAETVTAVATTSSTALPNLALVVPVGDGPVAVEYGSYVQSTVANGLVKLYLLRDGHPVHEVGCTVAGAGGVGHLRGRLRLPAGNPTTATFTVLLANWTPRAIVKALAMPLNPAFVQIHRL
jgi:hypothetical protein